MNSLTQLTTERRFVDRGEDSYDVIVGDVVIELTYNDDRGWNFWNVRIGNDRFGGVGHVPPGPFCDWLDEKRKADAP